MDLQLIEFRVSLRCLGRIDHDREWLVWSTLATTKLGQGRWVLRIAHQVISADALHCEDATGFDELGGALDRRQIAQGFNVGSKRNVRATIVTANGLRVIAPIGGIVILPSTCRAHLEGNHRRVVPVIGQVGDNRDSWAAVSARDEWVAIPSVGRVEQFFDTVTTDRRVRRDQRSITVGLVAGSDRKMICNKGSDLFGCHTVDLGKWRRLMAHPIEKQVDLGDGAGQIDEHT